MKFLQKIQYVTNTLTTPVFVVLDKMNVIHGDILYSLRNGLRFIARTQSSDVDEIVAIGSGYAYPLDLLPLIKHPLILDIGAYIGEFSIYAHYFYKGACRIIAIEPSTENFKYLSDNIKLNDVNVHTHNLGIHTKSGKAYLHTQDLPPDQYVIEQKRRNDSDQLCNIVSLQSFFIKNKLSNVDILKIDIEGTEHDLILDASTRNFLEKKIKFLFVELHDQTTERNSEKSLMLLSTSFTIVNKREHVFLLKNKLL